MPASRFSKALMNRSPLTPAVPVLIVALQHADKIGHAGSIPVLCPNGNLISVRASEGARQMNCARIGPFAESPSCLFILSARTILDLGVRDCSSVRKSPSNPSTFGPFSFGKRSHACWRYLELFNLAIDGKL